MIKTKTILLLIAAILITACGQGFLPQSIDTTQDQLGSGNYTVDATSVVDTKADILNMTDQEIVKMHMESLQKLIESLKKEDSQIPANSPLDKEKLIAALEDRVARLKSDEDFALLVAQRIRTMRERIAERRERAKEINCDLLKKVLDDPNTPAAIRDLEAKRHERHCSTNL